MTTQTTTQRPVKYPCQGCVYFAACGNTNRREPCAGRMTKTDRKRQEQAHAFHHLMQAAKAYA